MRPSITATIYQSTNLPCTVQALKPCKSRNCLHAPRQPVFLTKFLTKLPKERVAAPHALLQLVSLCFRLAPNIQWPPGWPPPHACMLLLQPPYPSLCADRQVEEVCRSTVMRGPHGVFLHSIALLHMFPLPRSRLTLRDPSFESTQRLPGPDADPYFSLVHA